MFHATSFGSLIPSRRFDLDATLKDLQKQKPRSASPNLVSCFLIQLEVHRYCRGAQKRCQVVVLWRPRVLPASSTPATPQGPLNGDYCGEFSCLYPFLVMFSDSDVRDSNGRPPKTPSRRQLIGLRRSSVATLSAA